MTDRAEANGLSKYGSKATVVDGHRFASQKEAKRYVELRLLLRLSKIRNLELQPKFRFPMGFSYVADFRYQTEAGETVIEDTKGFETAVFKLKAKCFRHFYPDLKLTVLKG